MPVPVPVPEVPVDVVDAASTNEPDGDEPTLFRATTEMVYDEEFESPAIVQVVPPVVVHEAPPGEAVTV